MLVGLWVDPLTVHRVWSRSLELDIGELMEHGSNMHLTRCKEDNIIWNYSTPATKAVKTNSVPFDFFYSDPELNSLGSIKVLRRTFECFVRDTAHSYAKRCLMQFSTNKDQMERILGWEAGDSERENGIQPAWDRTLSYLIKSPPRNIRPSITDLSLVRAMC